MPHRPLRLYTAFIILFCLPLVNWAQDKKQSIPPEILDLANRIATATSDAERQTLIGTNQTLVTAELVSALVEVGAGDKDDQHRLALLEFTKRAAHQIGNQSSLIRVNLEIAKTQLSSKNPAKAGEAFKEARNALPAIDNALQAGLILVEIGQRQSG